MDNVGAIEGDEFIVMTESEEEEEVDGICVNLKMAAEELERQATVGQEDQDRGSMECGVCHKVFKRKSELVRHEKTHVKRARLPCPYEDCSRNFSSPDILLRHEQIEHEGKRFVCPHCSKEYRSHSGFAYHVKKFH